MCASVSVIKNTHIRNTLHCGGMFHINYYCSVFLSLTPILQFPAISTRWCYVFYATVNEEDWKIDVNLYRCKAVMPWLCLTICDILFWIETLIRAIHSVDEGIAILLLVLVRVKGRHLLSKASSSFHILTHCWHLSFYDKNVLTAFTTFATDHAFLSYFYRKSRTHWVCLSFENKIVFL